MSISAKEIRLLRQPEELAAINLALREAFCLNQGDTITDYRALIRQECRGYTAQKVGGALVVECTVLDLDGVVKKPLPIEIDDNNRPLPEDITTFMGSEAEASLREGKGERILSNVFYERVA